MSITIYLSSDKPSQAHIDFHSIYGRRCFSPSSFDHLFVFVLQTFIRTYFQFIMSFRSARRFSEYIHPITNLLMSVIFFLTFIFPSLITNCGTAFVHLNSRIWFLQKGLLRECSSYFKNHLKDNASNESLQSFGESPGVTGLLNSSEPFELFVQWLYTGTIDDISTRPDRDHGAQLDIYIRLWCLCASSGLNVPVLQELAITRMKELYRTLGVSFSANHIRFIYEHNDSPNALRQHAIDAATHDLMATGPSATILEPSSSVDEPANTPRPSYTYRFTDHEFANNLLDNVLRYTGSARAPHPFGPAPSPPSSSASLSPPALFFTPSIHQSQPSISVFANPPPTPESTPRRRSTGTSTGTGSPRECIRQRANDSLNPTDIPSRGQIGFQFSFSEDPFGRVNEAELTPNLEPEPGPNPEVEANANTAPTTQTET